MNTKHILNDLRSGIVVFLVALPLCLGIAFACNAPPLSGLLAGIIGGVAVTIFSGSSLSVSGPAAGLTTIILTSAAVLGSYAEFVAAVFFAGLLQIIFGVIRMGNFGNYIPGSVVKGMLAGIGIILIVKQVPHLTGYDLDPEGDLEFSQRNGHNTFSELLYTLNSTTAGCSIIGLVSLVLMVFSRTGFYKSNRILSFVPGPLLAVAAGISLNIAFRHNADLSLSPEHMVDIPVLRSINDFREALFFPDFSAIGQTRFWTIAVTLALVASTESMLSLEAADRLDTRKRSSNFNKELIAQGIGNILSGLIGALPVTAVIVRSSANISSGAKSKWSSFFHGILLLVCVLTIPEILMLIPNASLAAVLIYTGYKLCDFSLIRDVFRKGADQFLPFIATTAVMLITDLLRGIAAGSIVAIIFIIRNSIRSSFEVVEDVIEEKKYYMVKLPTHLTFFNKGKLSKFLNSVDKDSKMIIDGSANKITDTEVREIFLDFIELSRKKNIEIEFIKYNLN